MKNIESEPTPRINVTKDKRVARARVSAEMFSQLMGYAKQHNTSPSDVVRKALEMYFKAHEKDAV